MSSVLLVDDTAELRSLLARGLEFSGFEVMTADSGGAALRALGSRTFDIVVTDIVMPDMDGLELIRTIRKAHPALGIIAISGGGHSLPDHYLELAARFGAARTLQKPFGFDTLAALIHEVLGTPD